MNNTDNIRASVSKTYTRAVQNNASTSSCCSGPAPKGIAATLAGYSREALTALPKDAVANSFGCGNPVVLSEVREGETVLDLGSGAGIDLLIAAKLTGPKGRVIGVDMTDAMIEHAWANAKEAGLTNIEIRKGIIENLPVKDDSVDLVISNCVINLSPEKHKVFSEIHRVLKSGGRFSISDIVAEPMPEWIIKSGTLHSACISGAITEQAYTEGLRQAGLVNVTIKDRLVYEKEQLKSLLDSELTGSCCCGSTALPKKDLKRIVDALAGKVASIRVVGLKK